METLENKNQKKNAASFKKTSAQGSQEAPSKGSDLTIALNSEESRKIVLDKGWKD